MKTTISVLALWCLFSVTAYGQTQVPNTFQAGQPARAAEVNDNFSTLVAATNQNATEITANTAGIASNLSSISTNSTNIGGNTQSITNVSQSVDTNTQDIDTVAQAVAALMPPPSFQFVGFSAATVTGGVGVFAMNAACQASFGANSRMASSREVLDSTTTPIPAGNTAWVKPVVVAASAVDGNTQYVWDYSGLSHFRADISCGGWSTTTKEGLSINWDGNFAVGACTVSMFVACSAAQ